MASHGSAGQYEQKQTLDRAFVFILLFINAVFFGIYLHIFKNALFFHIHLKSVFFLSMGHMCIFQFGQSRFFVENAILPQMYYNFILI